ncbi:MAG: hypothetical protein AAF600_12870 [Bacteroidota bacterium]
MAKRRTDRNRRSELSGWVGLLELPERKRTDTKEQVSLPDGSEPLL